MSWPNGTEKNIIGIVFGWTFAIPGAGDITRDYIFPIIKQDLSFSQIPGVQFLFFFLWVAIFLATVQPIQEVAGKMEKTYNLYRGDGRFWDYFGRALFTGGVILIIGIFIKIKLGI